MTIIYENTTEEQLDDGGPFGLVCQHCSYNLGVVFLLPEEQLSYMDILTPTSPSEKKQYPPKEEPPTDDE